MGALGVDTMTGVCGACVLGEGEGFWKETCSPRSLVILIALLFFTGRTKLVLCWGVCCEGVEAACACDWLGVEAWPTLEDGRSEVWEGVRAMLGGMNGG